MQLFLRLFVTSNPQDFIVPGPFIFLLRPHLKHALRVAFCLILHVRWREKKCRQPEERPNNVNYGLGRSSYHIFYVFLFTPVGCESGVLVPGVASDMSYVLLLDRANPRTKRTENWV